MECQNQQWSPNANMITYQLREVYNGTIGEEPTMAVTTRAMRGSASIEDELDGQENYSSDCHQKYPTLQFRPSPSQIVMMTP